MPAICLGVVEQHSIKAAFAPALARALRPFHDDMDLQMAQATLNRRDTGESVASEDGDSAAASDAASPVEPEPASPPSRRWSADRLLQRSAEARRTWREAARVTTTCRPDRAALLAFVATLLPLVEGFYRVTHPDSGIKCELVNNYLYYRIAVALGLWWWLLARIAVDIATTIANEFVWVTPDAPRSAASLWQVLLYATLERGVRPFVETLCVVTALTTCWHYLHAICTPPVSLAPT